MVVVVSENYISKELQTKHNINCHFAVCSNNGCGCSYPDGGFSGGSSGGSSDKVRYNGSCDSSTPVCAKDLRSGGPQNFNSECKMLEENKRGGSELLLSNITI